MILSSGRIHLLYLMLRALKEEEGLDQEELSYRVELASETFTKDLFSEVLREAVTAGLLAQTADQRLSRTSRGIASIEPLERSDVISAKRNILAAVITASRRELIRFSFAEKGSLDALGDAEAECFIQLGLADYTLSEEASLWWEKLRKSGSKINAEILTAIGDRAEVASITHEQFRLQNYLGTPGVAQIEWVSRETDLAGFDILSFTGSTPDPLQRLPIEVKKLSREPSQSTFFYLSRNEFETANKIPDYTFHLWEHDRITKTATLWIPETKLVLASTPLDQANGYWQSCRINFSETDLKAIRAGTYRLID
jgi:hypothetical protein